MPDKDDKLIIEAWWDPRSWGKKGKKGNDDEKRAGGVDPSDPDYLNVDQPDEIKPIKPIVQKSDDEIRAQADALGLKLSDDGKSWVPKDAEPAGAQPESINKPTRIVLPDDHGLIEMTATQAWISAWQKHANSIPVQHGIGFAEDSEDGPFLTVSFTDKGFSGAMSQNPGHSYFAMPGDDVLLIRSIGDKKEPSDSWLIRVDGVGQDDLKKFLVEFWEEFQQHVNDA